MNLGYLGFFNNEEINLNKKILKNEPPKLTFSFGIGTATKIPFLILSSSKLILIILAISSSLSNLVDTSNPLSLIKNSGNLFVPKPTIATP